MLDMHRLCQINGKIKFQSQTWLFNILIFLIDLSLCEKGKANH